MTVLVTGASGFLGGSVVPRLITDGHDVAALVRSSPAAERVAELGAEPVRGDLDDHASLDAAFAACGARRLVNLASLGFGHAPAIVAAAQEAGVTRAVFLSTTAIFTRLDAVSKGVRMAAEACIAGSGLDWTVLRPTMIYGAPGDRNLSRLLALLRRWQVVPQPGGGRRLQQPVHVDDVAAAVVAAVRTDRAISRCYDLAGPEPLPLRALVQAAGEALGVRPLLVPVPLAPAVAVARLYERLATRPRVRAEQLARLAEDKAYDISPAMTDLDFRPRSFAAGIRAEAALLACRPAAPAAKSRRP